MISWWIFCATVLTASLAMFGIGYMNGRDAGEEAGLKHQEHRIIREAKIQAAQILIDADRASKIILADAREVSRQADQVRNMLAEQYGIEFSDKTPEKDELN